MEILTFGLPLFSVGLAIATIGGAIPIKKKKVQTEETQDRVIAQFSETR